METFPTLINFCEGNPLVRVDSPRKGPVWYGTLMFLCCYRWTSCWINSQVASGLICHCVLIWWTQPVVCAMIMMMTQCISIANELEIPQSGCKPLMFSFTKFSFPAECGILQFCGHWPMSEEGSPHGLRHTLQPSRHGERLWHPSRWGALGWPDNGLKLSWKLGEL